MKHPGDIVLSIGCQCNFVFFVFFFFIWIVSIMEKCKCYRSVLAPVMCMFVWKLFCSHSCIREAKAHKRKTHPYIYMNILFLDTQNSEDTHSYDLDCEYVLAWTWREELCAFDCRKSSLPANIICVLCTCVYSPRLKWKIKKGSPSAKVWRIWKKREAKIHIRIKFIRTANVCLIKGHASLVCHFTSDCSVICFIF